jgi:hypothetical protein
MPSFINFQDATTYPGHKFRRMMGRQIDMAQGFDTPEAFAVKVSNDNPGKLEAAPGIAWIRDEMGGVYFVERETNPLYTGTVGTSGIIVLRVKDLNLYDGENALVLEAIPTGDTIPVRSLQLASYTGSGSDAVLKDARLSTPGQFIVSRSGPANYGAPNTAVMGLGQFAPGTQYTDLTTGARYVKTTDGSWSRDKGEPGKDGTGAGTVTAINTVQPDDTGNVTISPSDLGAVGVTEKGVANGVAALNQFGNVPTANLPDLGATYIRVNTKGSANGVPSLDANSRIPTAQLPVMTVSKSMGITAPVAGSYAVWQATSDCIVTSVRAVRVGGTSATVNAGVNTLDLLPLDLSLTVAGTWSTGPNIQNTAVKAGDSLFVHIRSVAGAPSYINIQIDVKGV